MNGAVSSPQSRTSLPKSALVDDEDDSFNNDDGSADQELMDAVISSLHAADRRVAVAEQFANDKKDRSQDKVPAYAKIAGRDWTYFVQDSRVNIGRPPDDKPSQTGAVQSSPAADTQDLFPVNIDLGPSKFISRHHAEISYRSDEGGVSGWQITVNGRNGVRLNNTLVKRGGTRSMKCGDILEIANTQMMFVTPNENPIIHPSFLEQARKAAAGDDTWNGSQHAHPETSGSRSKPSLPQSTLYPTIGNQAIAPAPPSFRRETTPPPRKMGDPSSQAAKQSPLYNRGVMMESTEDIDYSADAAKDLKPPYSYATMIAQAIFSNEEEKLTLSNIYSYIMKRYAFYRNSQTGWQVSNDSYHIRLEHRLIFRKYRIRSDTISR